MGSILIDLYEILVNKQESYSFPEVFFIGLSAAVSVISINSIWFPSDTGLAVILSIVSILYLIFTRERNITGKFKKAYAETSKFQICMILVGCFVLLLFSIMPPQFPDVFIYHIQNIMWNEQYSVIPGLANLDEHFGFNSNLFLLASTFGLRPLSGEFVYAVNAVCLVMVWIYIVGQSVKQNAFHFILYLVIFIAFIILYKVHIGCSSTDLLPNLLIVFVLYIILFDHHCLKKKTLLFVLVPISCITFKVSSIFICLIPLYLFILLLKEKEYKSIFFFLICTLLIVAPWLIRNVIISGYLVHPYPTVDLFNFDWKLPTELALTSNEYVRAFAISMDAWTSSKEILDLSFSEKISLWLRDTHIIFIYYVVFAFFSIFLMLFFIIRKRLMLKQKPLLMLLWAIGICGFFFFLYSAPAVRFGFGFIAIVFSIPFYFVFDKEKRLAHRPFFNNVVILCAIMFIGFLSINYFIAIKDNSISYRSLLYKPQSIETMKALYPLEVDSVYVINKHPFTKIKGTKTYDNTLPSTFYNVEQIEMRGEGLQNGFRTKK